MARFFRRLASFSRFDRRGAGLSDRPSDAGSSEVEHWLQDCAAVLDAVGSTAATFVGMRTVEIGALVLQFVDRPSPSLLGARSREQHGLLGGEARLSGGSRAGGHPGAQDFRLRTGGTVEFATRFAPGQARNESFARWLAKPSRSMASPRAPRREYGLKLD